MTQQSLTEDAVVSGFHSLLKDSLAQARGEGLLTDEELEEGDVAIQLAGPCLALYFASLGSSSDPPAIVAPDGSFTLTSRNVPPSFASFFELWQDSVKPIQRLSSEARYDLALLLVDKEPLSSSSPLRIDVARLASNLKGIALEITQRRTFQLRYQADLEAALDSRVRPRRSGDSGRPSSVQYVPPPGYEGDQVHADEKRAFAPPPPPPRPAGHPASPGPADAPQLLENLAIIRETLYSALADTLVSTPSVAHLLARGPEWASRAYFAATCLSILEVALTRVDTDGVRVVQMGGSSPRVIGARETPPYLRRFLGALIEVSQAARQMAEEDDERAMREAAEGDITSEPRIDRLRERLENGPGAHENEAAMDQTVASLSNEINRLAIGMASLPAFAERQAEVFKILSGVSAI